ncbi:MAG: Phosphatidylglycerol/phosphatidylinositol transfer protein [Alectoria fallacina]|uniref:Phosphatidylglycerol/phosphatidylinositol transfer protein n=1 Tax=Alectoria fallacina TaxID=1903189 RepID=A0A8H3I4T4_9LECA|nr:MAG: Phosphatidylglycerol/phosphatidylinositol transfer protein [Alectoria fallacina]
MKLTPTLLLLFLSSFATSNSLSFFSSNQQVLDENHKVPGDNPLEFCDKSDDYILTINNVDLEPNPPLPGKTLTIEAKGNFTKKVEEGAYLVLVVKYGLIRLINQQADLCEQMKSAVDEDCPLIGEKTITKDVDLPREIPPGHYTVFADVYTKDHVKITCLTATVKF